MIRNSLLVFLLAFLYYASGTLSLNLLSGNSIINVGLFAAEGIALAFALYFGKKVLPGIFLGQFFLALDNDISFAASLSIALINTAEAYLAVVLFKKFHLHTNLEKFRDISGLVLLIFFVLQPLSALLSNTVLLATHHISIEKFPLYLFSWWFGNVMGQLVFTPFLLLLFTNFQKIKWKFFFLYGILFSYYLYLLQIVFHIENTLLLLSLSLPVVALASAYKGLVYGTFFNVLVAVIASYAVYLDIGAFAVNNHIDNVINYNLFVLLHVSVILTIGTLIEERKKYIRTLEETIATEVKKSQEQQLLLYQQSRLAQMGEMISMIAHQWRQPLNNLALINQLTVSKYAKGKLDDKAVEYFKSHSKKQIDLMSDTIDNFRNFFKKEDKTCTFSLNDAIKEVLSITADIYKNEGIFIEFNATREYALFANPNALSQVLLNILNNAKDALLQTTQNKKKIEITLEDTGTELLLAIQDNAGGIDKAIKEKIFDPYFSTKQEKNGTGLGLYMTKMVLQEQLHAAIEVFNDNEGANFVIRLPKGTE
ncbi:MASE1 domain-containing protein [Sulfurimonas sp. SWIR-19]|uniref:ATP-binding protein n=1 Tax=Sulfurimonas sp. SWIR-19 TaxID=2878390 RepID=UPI001CF17A91|nr:ATP-binding protein [Sulfurimonas sp. SWIR-19]UCN00248.1 MASE1 domain-containing protein [Sulfurimonas sp. SWIR-19]